MNKVVIILCLLAAVVSNAAAPLFSQGSAFEASVYVVEDKGASRAFRAESGLVRELFKRGLLGFTNKQTEKEAWYSILKPEDVVGIKVFTSPGPNSGTRLACAAAMVESLLAAGFAPSNIVVWDKRESDLQRAGFFELKDRYKIDVVAAQEAGYSTNAYESPLIGNLVWGDVEFGKRGEGIGRKSYVTKLLTQRITKNIVFSPMLNHNLAGVTGSLYSMAMGSIDNTIRFDVMGERLATAIPEIFALEEIYDRCVLYVMDGIICQYLGEERTLLHYSTQSGQFWFSKDPVALDILAINEMKTQRSAAGIREPRHHMDIYRNAALLELGTAELRKIRVERN